ncbi:MAG TPA: MaoC family dehydratase N-terminal domain-containing protein [Candidatus Binataceae bacterium]|nr:MaoC family dehydratase N-terminal domain-containing protein [Candidatus Binataceae bacterium]
MPLNKSCIGKEFAPLTTEVTGAAMQEYARAYNEDNPAFFDAARPGGLVAPPMFAVVVTWNSTLNAVMDPEVGADLLRLVHGEQDMWFQAPIRPGDRITSHAKITAIDTKATGETITIELGAVNQHGVAVSHSVFSAFIRGGGRRAGPREMRTDEPPHGEPILTVRQSIDADQTFRYAEASGDRNPIHVDENVARMAGLPGLIVHGLCTMAFTSKVMIDNLCEGDPTRLKRLRVRFSRPVRPGETITTRVWPAGEREGRRVFAYETSAGDGQAVIRGGIAEVSY